MVGNKRFYHTSGGVFPSVTTVLGANEAGWLEEWKAAVGEAKAAKIAATASDRGSSVHLCLEDYVIGKNVSFPLNPSHRGMVKGMMRELDTHLTSVKGIEIPLYSKVLGMAGRADLLGVWDGELSIIDYKTANKIKSEDDILSYFAQTSAYSMMVEELYGLDCKQLVILIGTEAYGVIKFVKHRDRKYIRYLGECLRRYTEQEAAQVG